MTGAIAEPVVSLAEAQAYTRVDTGEEEAILAGLIRTAHALCEAFVGQTLIERELTEVVTASGEWQRLSANPVRSIDSVSSNGAALPASAYAIDVDSSGTGWVRVIDPTVGGAVEVTATAGIASDRNAIPEPIRQGVLRLVAHLFESRDSDGGNVPAAVTALWRPYRRIRIG